MVITWNNMKIIRPKWKCQKSLFQGSQYLNYHNSVFMSWLINSSKKYMYFFFFSYTFIYWKSNRDRTITQIFTHMFLTRGGFLTRNVKISYQGFKIAEKIIQSEAAIQLISTDHACAVLTHSFRLLYDPIWNC